MPNKYKGYFYLCLLGLRCKKLYIWCPLILWIFPHGFEKVFINIKLGNLQCGEVFLFVPAVGDSLIDSVTHTMGQRCEKILF